MNVEVVRRAVGRFENGEILAFEMRVPLGTAIDSEQKRQIGIVGVQCPLLAQVELLIPGTVAKNASRRLQRSS